MTLPPVVSREEWLAARKELLAEEKEFTRARDRLNAHRRRLPMVRVDKQYTFEGPAGTVSLQADGEVFHTYSTFGRGIEEFHNGYPYLDLTALGRQEEWEEPKGRATQLGLQVGGPNMRLPDEYAEA
jgi:predicted dithiol-disulfide oxidoreductase (DUF899 family)